MDDSEFSSMQWDAKKLIEFGANKEFVNSLSPRQAKEPLKNILYAIERYRDST